MPSVLDSLRKVSIVVADTGDIDAVARWQPQDANTNPSLVLASTEDPRSRRFVAEALERSRGEPLAAIDWLFVLFGAEILKHIPGRVSTEVDAHLSFDEQGSIAKARHFISLYEKLGIAKERILIKLASTWEGIRAAQKLEREGIHCNMTLLFGMHQAVAAAEARVTLISPFVGRILDWYKKDTGKDYKGADDPGVQSVTTIYNYYKHFGYKTQVMGASFRNIGEIEELAGCDLLTISPQLLGELEKTEGELPRKLDAEKAKSLQIEKIPMDQATFERMHAEDRMAHDKLAEGIDGFSKALVNLEGMLAKRLAELEQRTPAGV